jgi:hypothetical protein
MVLALVALLAATAPQEGVPRVVHEEPPAAPVHPLAGAAEVVSLCKQLVPAERLRPGGDAVVQGESRSRQEAGRDEAITARYELTVDARDMVFAPYDGAEQRLGLAPPATLRLPGGAVVLTAALERSLPVRVDAGTARRIVAAQRDGRLSLRLTFDLPDDVVCGGDRRGKRFTLSVEPVEWRWVEGEVVLAWGGTSGDRPAVSATVGARPEVQVGDPIAGPAQARGAVAAHGAQLSACYAEALQRDASTDGVLVVDLGARVVVAADSTGSPELARCVERALAALAPATRASVPIRFELAAPTPAASAE